MTETILFPRVGLAVLNLVHLMMNLLSLKACHQKVLGRLYMERKKKKKKKVIKGHYFWRTYNRKSGWIMEGSVLHSKGRVSYDMLPFSLKTKPAFFKNFMDEVCTGSIVEDYISPLLLHARNNL